MLGLLVMALLPVALLSILPHVLGGQDGADAQADLDPDHDDIDADDGLFEAMEDDPLAPDVVQITDFAPSQDRLQLVVDGDGTGMVTTAPDPQGRGTLVSYDGAVVALVHGHDAAAVGPVDVIARTAG